MADSCVTKLLEQWNLENYAVKFEDRQITNYTALAQLTPEVIRVLIEHDDDRMNFEERWITWCCKWFEDTENLDPNEHRNSGEILIDKQKALFCLLSEEKLRKILQSRFESSCVLIHYNRTGEVPRTYQNIIADAIVAHLLMITRRGWLNSHYETIAKNIVKIFTCEVVDTYYVPADENTQLKGKIPDKFKNFLALYRSVSGATIKRKHTADKRICKRLRGADQEKSVQQSLDWLKVNAGPLNEVLVHWRETADFRAKWLSAEKYPLIADIHDDWPILKTHFAPQLIKEDFLSLGLVDGEPIEHWQEFFDTVRSESENKSVDTAMSDLLDLIDHELTSENGKILCQLLALHHFCAPKGKVKKAESSKSGRASIPEAKDSMLVHVFREADIAAIQDKKIKDAGRLNVQPYIIAVGSTVDTADHFFINLDKTLYPIGSAAEAIDICFKIFHVWDGIYPSASKHIWMLIQIGLYRFTTKADIKIPHMAKLLTKLRNHVYLKKTPQGTGKGSEKTVEVQGESREEGQEIEEGHKDTNE